MPNQEPNAVDEPYKASFTKLPTGEWGVRVSFKTPENVPERGDTITVTRQHRSAHQVTLRHPIWTGERTALFAIARKRSESTS